MIVRALQPDDEVCLSVVSRAEEIRLPIVPQPNEMRLPGGARG